MALSWAGALEGGRVEFADEFAMGRCCPRRRRVPGNACAGTGHFGPGPVHAGRQRAHSPAYADGASAHAGKACVTQAPQGAIGSPRCRFHSTPRGGSSAHRFRLCRTSTYTRCPAAGQESRCTEAASPARRSIGPAAARGEPCRTAQSGAGRAGRARQRDIHVQLGSGRVHAGCSHPVLLRQRSAATAGQQTSHPPCASEDKGQRC